MSRRAWLWAGGSLVGYVLAFIVAAVGVAIPLSGIEPPLPQALWASSWVLLSGLVAWLLGRYLIRLDLRTTARAWLGLVGGAALNGAFVVALIASVSARMGMWDPEFAGPTMLMWAVIAGLATAGFGVLVAPPGAVTPPALAVWFGTLVVTVIVALNVPGSLDGIRPESWPLAIVMGAVLTYAIGLAVVSVRAVLTE